MAEKDGLACKQGAMRDNSPPARLLNLQAIASTLRATQDQIGDITDAPEARRDEFYDEIRRNMVACYTCLDNALANRVDLFANGGSGLLLELNNIVLYGTDTARRKTYASSIATNEQQFYENPEGGIGDLVDAYQMHRLESIWNRCALVYIHMLSQPQLFIEGNHRTGALLMSYLLVRE
jgi:hypothetical protein